MKIFKHRISNCFQKKNEKQKMSLNETLKKYDLFLTLPKVSALLTIPSLHANSYRIENLIYLILSNCKKSNFSPTISEIESWLNEDLDRSQEDPVEDVFVTNIITPLGNYRIFEGLWESNDFFVQKTIDVLSSKTEEYKKLLFHIFELLKLSDIIVEKSGLKRWDHSEQTNSKHDIKLSSQLEKESKRIIFTLQDLRLLNIHIELLKPFIFKPEHTRTLTNKNYGCSELEKKPLIYLENKLIVALPNAIGAAIRNYLISEFKKINSLNKLEKMFFEYEISLLEKPTVSPIFRLISKSKIQHGIAHSIPLLKDWLVKYDLDKYLHVILHHSPIDQTKSIYDADKKISEYIEKVFNFCKSQSNFKEGISVVVLGSDGLNTVGIKKGLEIDKSSWYTSFLPTYDFLKLSISFDKNWSLKTYLKFLSQKKYSEINGGEYINLWGDYTLYCLWYLQDCNLISKNIPFLPHIVFPLNKQIRKSVDNHVSKDVNGRYFPVMSYNVFSYFPSITNLPIYISLHHLFDKGILKIVVENKNTAPKWLTFKCKPNFMDICHTLLNSGLSVLYQKIVIEIENLYKDRTADILEVCLNFEETKLESEVINNPQLINKTEVLFDFKNNKAEIKFPYNFFRNFNNPDNKGEKEIIRNIVLSLICLYEKKEKQMEKEVLDVFVNKVVKKDMRIFHIFNKDILYKFAQKRTTNFEWTYADEIFIRVKILKKLSNEESGVILRSENAQNFLNTLFKNIFLHIKSKLKLFNRKSLMCKLIEIYESELHKNEHWNKTIGAVISLYEDGGKIAELKNRNRDAIKKSSQILLEMAICECPENTGKKISSWDIDELLAETLLLIEVATDSNILKNNLCVPEIKIESNGEYSIDRNFLQTLMRPYIRDSTFLIYKQKTQRYKELYESYQPNGKKLSQINENFICEFGLSIGDLSKICNSLFKIAIKKNSLVVETTVDEIEKRCKEDGLPYKAVKSFINSFAIFHRSNWENPPSGFTTKDIFPSKYNRRLSFNVRPLLVFSKLNTGRVFYGIQNVYMAMNYLLHQIEEGNFPIEFFKSTQMKSLCGKINNKKGDEFNKKVAYKLKELKWNIKLNVKMSELGASNELGDIDILAWKNHRIKIIESKRLQPARSINEIIWSLKRFKGENNDLLQKHLNRVNWIKNNSTVLKNIVKYTPNLDHINGVIVTNILIPSQYVDHLSIDFDSIITINNLEDKL